MISPELFSGAEIGSAQRNPYWSPDDDWNREIANEAIKILDAIAART